MAGPSRSEERRVGKECRSRGGPSHEKKKIKSKWTAGGKRENSTYPCAAREALTLRPFFFSSRRRHTRSLRDWSSDVCSSDLRRSGWPGRCSTGSSTRRTTARSRRADGRRSEERRVGKECRSRWSPYH